MALFCLIAAEFKASMLWFSLKAAVTLLSFRLIPNDTHLALPYVIYEYFIGVKMTSMATSYNNFTAWSLF